MTPAADRVLQLVGEIPAGRYLVAVSGGADSAVVATVIADADPGPLRLVHLDHGRPSSAPLAAAAEKLASHLDLALEIVTLEVPPGSWENAARVARLDALERLAGSEQIIVTGHHRDDLVETVLGNLVRGAGVRGLTGFRERRGRWWRPLRVVPGELVRAAAVELQLPFLDDPDNFDLRFRRNRIRHEVLPALEAMNPRAREAIARTADHLGIVDELLGEQVDAIPLVEDAGAWTMALGVLRTLPEPLRALAASRLVRKARPPHPPTAQELARIDAVISGGARRAQIAGGYVVTGEGAMLAVYLDVSADTPEPIALGIGDEKPFGIHGIAVIRLSGGRIPPGGVALATDVAEDGIEIRGAREGDRLDIEGGSKAVRTVLAEGGVPLRLRPGWPLVVARGKIAAVVGLRAAPWARASDLLDAIVVTGGRDVV